jgi:hypothetical protein
MALWGSIVGLAGVTRLWGGPWRFLILWVEGRRAVELERERNRATAEMIRLLPRNCELLEYEPKGRLRVIRRSGPVTPAVVGGMLTHQTVNSIDEHRGGLRRRSHRALP